MIDIHSHVIFGVDDGAKTLEESIKIIKEEIDNGITDLICTPHYRAGMFNASIESIEKNFLILKEEVLKQNLSINLYLGREVYFDKYLYKSIDSYKLNGKNIIPYIIDESVAQDIDTMEDWKMAEIKFKVKNEL